MTATSSELPERSPGSDSAAQRYQQQLESIDAQRDHLKARDRMFGKLRVVLFFTALVFWIIGYGFDGIAAVGWLGWLALAGFLVVATLNEPVRDRLLELRRHRSVIQRLIARLHRDWDRLATPSLMGQLAEIELPGHRREVASDLDLLGRASLFHLISMAATRPGIRTLAQWLAGPVQADVARHRAVATEALAPRRQERLRFYTLARQVGESSGDPDHFVAWATDEPWLQQRSWLVVWSRISSFTSAAAILAAVLAIAISSRDLFWGSLITLAVLIVINLGITTLMLGPAHAIFAIAMANRRAVDNYRELFQAGEWLPDPAGRTAARGATAEENPQTPPGANATADSAAMTAESAGILGRLHRALVSGERNACEGMQQLQKVARAGSLRQSAGTFLIYLPLQGLTLWDIKVLRRLEQWQQHYGDRIPQWFDALGELEALMSIAALRDDYPDWSQPVWQANGEPATLRAVGIGHPLLPDEARVCNDVTVGPPGTLLLVTGSNMSGKSTLLRSIGLNSALAAVGAPVCAKQLALPSLELATSIRVSDDVSQGVSFYMAELKRLKSVVDHARVMAQSHDRVCLFLLDEILQGTNSRERQIAVVQVLRHLVASRAIGAISTHDLELADEPELQSIAETVHFRETIEVDASGNDRMTFDYHMRQGVSPTTNALRLLEMVGLGHTEPEGVSHD